MTIDLSEYESGEKYDGDYSDTMKALQERLSRIQAKHIIYNHRSIIVFQGWDAAGKGGAIRRMVAQWDPRYFEVHPIGAPTSEEKDRHFLWRFWKRLPGSREIGIFDRSWYGRVLVERIEEYCSKAEWKRGYDEINEFESQQIDSGTSLIKLFFHTTQETQDKRFADRLDTPEKRWKITEEDFRNRSKREDYLVAIQDMFEYTDTRWAPWKVLDGNNKKAARIAALTYVADQLDAALPKELPEVEPDMVKLAEDAFGYEADRPD